MKSGSKIFFSGVVVFSLSVIFPLPFGWTDDDCRWYSLKESKRVYIEYSWGPPQEYIRFTQGCTPHDRPKIILDADPELFESGGVFYGATIEFVDMPAKVNGVLRTFPHVLFQRQYSADSLMRMEVVQSELGDFQGSIHITLSPGPKNLLASAIITTTGNTQEVKMEGPTGQPVPRLALPVGERLRKLFKVNGLGPSTGATGTDMMAPPSGMGMEAGGGDGHFDCCRLDDPKICAHCRTGLD